MILKNIINFLRKRIFAKASFQFNYVYILDQVGSIVYKQLYVNKFQECVSADLHACYSLPKKRAKEIAKELVKVYGIEMTATSETFNEILEKNAVLMNEEGKDEFKNGCKLFGLYSVAFEYYIPLFTLLFAKVYNLILKKPVGSVKISVQRRMTTEELYDKLKTLPDKAALILLENLSCTTSCFDHLNKSWRKNNKKEFVNIIHSNEVDISKISRDCYYLQFISTSFYFILNFQKEFKDGRINKINIFNMLSFFKETMDDFEIDIPYIKEAAEYTISDDDNLDSLFLKSQNLIGILQGILKDFLKIGRLCEFSAKEQMLIDRIVGKNQYINNLYNETLRELEQEEGLTCLEDMSKMNNDKEFTLADNYFELECNPDDRVSVDAFCPLINTQGVETFEKFINDIAQEGYIDNDIITKESFAYRLTGICKPENLLDQIEWKKEKDPNSHCLFCIIKYFYQGNGRKGIKHPTLPQGRYERMQIFFSCKSSSNYSEDARRITPEFEKQLNSWYPGIAPNLKRNENK